MPLNRSSSTRTVNGILTTHGLHGDIHDLIAAINQELAEYNHQLPHYGELKSMLHAHMLCHALRQDTRLYVEIDGREYPIKSTRRRVDNIGRADNALVFEV